MNILYVEDDLPLRYGIARELRALQHTVYEADDSESALVLLAEHEVDVLCVDVGLPGESGDVFAAEARSLRPHVRLVFCTGLSRFTQSSNAEVDLHVLRKPFSLEQLLAALSPPVSEHR